jgi:hypothetical protein
LAFSGDEIGGFLNKPIAHLRQRSENFGSNDDWLQRVKADVVFAFFGFNESFAGPAGLPKFREQLDNIFEGDNREELQWQGFAAHRVIFTHCGGKKSMTRIKPDNPEQRKRGFKSLHGRHARGGSGKQRGVL